MYSIKFHVAAPELAWVPPPYPASRHLPDWFRNMPADCEQGGTLKRCPPFLTAMTAGYIIPAPADVHFKMSSQGELSVRCAISFLDKHFAKQFEGSPFAGHYVVKFHNPWIIVTPPEYVCLITAPINRYELPFLPLTGIVETGTYYKQVQLPMACYMQPNQSCELRRGAPMIQVIPFRRDEWTFLTEPIDSEHREEQQAMFDADPHTYKEKFWKKMPFS